MSGSQDEGDLFSSFHVRPTIAIIEGYIPQSAKESNESSSEEDITNDDDFRLGAPWVPHWPTATLEGSLFSILPLELQDIIINCMNEYSRMQFSSVCKKARLVICERVTLLDFRDRSLGNRLAWCAARFANVTSADFAGHPIQMINMDRVTGFTKLSSLSLARSQAQSPFLYPLTQLASLTYLNLQYSQVTDDDIASTICALTNLRVLYIRVAAPDESARNVTDLGLVSIGMHLTKLKQLMYSTGRSTRADQIRPKYCVRGHQFHNLASLPSLDWLDISHTDVTTESLQGLLQLGSIKTLILTGCARVGHTVLFLLAEMKSLERVHLCGSLFQHEFATVAGLHEVFRHFSRNSKIEFLWQPTFMKESIVQ